MPTYEILCTETTAVTRQVRYEVEADDLDQALSMLDEAEPVSSTIIAGDDPMARDVEYINGEPFGYD